MPPRAPARNAKHHENADHGNSSVPLQPTKHSRTSSSEATLEALVTASKSRDLAVTEDTRNKGRKRKRTEAKDDLEDSYMRQLVHEEAKEEVRQALERRSTGTAPIETRHVSGERTSSPAEDDSVDELEDTSLDIFPDGIKGITMGGMPQHESVASNKDVELEKASRTVFLANISTAAIKSKSARKTLVDHLTSLGSASGEQRLSHALESIRFRSIPFSDGRLPKKAAYAKRELMDSTAKSMNAYAIYTSQAVAREAVKKLNGSLILDRHLRVDGVAHPAKQDHRRCVFVGNLGFVDDESAIKEAEDNENNRRPRKVKEPADYEEGLWRTFGKAGAVESVRLVRDKTTRVGKGFAYVQFIDANAVEKALLYNGKQFPPMLPRKIRVVRAKNSKKSMPEDKKNSLTNAPHSQRLPPAVRSLNGRSNKLLGRAAAAQLKDWGSVIKSSRARNPESFVFEGHRASQGLLKKGESAKKRGKPQNRSSRRGAEFKRQKAKN